MAEAAISLRGVFPPVPTPFDTDGEVHLRALTDHLVRLNQHGLAGYVVLGSNGEVVYLTREEKLSVWERARESIPADRLMLAGTGCQSTRETISLTRLAGRVGADAALVVTPHYYSPSMTSEALVRHYLTVADASPIPILVYNVPKFTNVNMSAESIARASRHPNIIGVKDTGGNVTQLAETVRLAEPGFQVLAGAAGFFLAALAVGAVGGILALANIAPEQALDIYRWYREGRWDDAAELQRRMIPVNAAVTARFGIAGLKAAMDILGYHGGAVRAPLMPLDGAELHVLRDILAEGGLLA